MTTTQTYRVTGMTCDHCTAAVNEQLVELGAGVTDVTVHLVPGDVSTVTVESDAGLDRDAVAAAVDEAGYTLLA